MLEDYLRQQDIDIVQLQEVTHTKITSFRRYNAYVNVGTENRGTAILAKGLPLTNTTLLPSGRGIAVSFEDIKIINIYAPSGAEKRREKEALYDTEVPILLPSTPAEILLAADFICSLPCGQQGTGKLQ
jgi:exonuclease III